MKYSYIDLFAGCGGLSDGFESSKAFVGLAHIEWEDAACKTLRRRLESKWGHRDTANRVLRFDMQRMGELLSGWKQDPDYGGHPGLATLVNREQEGVDLIIGGPPCQAYSVAGRVRDEHGMHLDYRNYLFEKYLEIVSQYRPRAFLFENVPGILSASPGGISIVDRIRGDFEDAGYATLSDLGRAVIDLREYGVPQRRTRVIILGLDRRAFPNYEQMLETFYTELLPLRRQPMVTAGSALSDLPPLHPAKAAYSVGKKRFSHSPSKSEVPDHVPRFHNERDIKTFRMLAQDLGLPIERRKYATIEDIHRLYTERTGKSSAVHKYFVIRPDEPSNTIPAHLYKDGLRHIHWDPEQARTITVREAARLQSFPDDFEFVGSQSDAYKMIGNAVPPAFSRVVADALRDLLAARPRDVRATASKGRS